jgi:F-type H+-transporting ATPase subunit epsilon
VVALPSYIDLHIVTPERMIVQEKVDEVQIPGWNGFFGVLPGHTPLLAALSVGELWYRKGQERTYLSVAYGFAEVLPERVTILAQLAERAEEIDVERAEAAHRRAVERLAETSDVDYERARIALTKSLTRLQVSSRIASGAGPRLKRVQREGV